MYTLTIKDNGPDLDIVITRAMLALSAIAAIVYRTDDYYFLNLTAAILLVIAAVFIRFLLEKFRIKKFILLLAAAIVLFIATRSFSFAIILLVYGYLVKFLTQKPLVSVSTEGIKLTKLFNTTLHKWADFSNVILKDGLLTLDFQNNKLLQVNIDAGAKPVDELAFNNFCRMQL